jgi:hypothetical protein
MAEKFTARVAIFLSPFFCGSLVEYRYARQLANCDSSGRPLRPGVDTDWAGARLPMDAQPDLGTPLPF